MNKDFTLLLQIIGSYASSGEERSEILYNTCKLLKDKVYHYDWVGFYVLDGQGSKLLLETYYGKPTEHNAISIGKGVCGQVAENKKLKTVQDIRQEKNYIACSLDVQSEIVVPILKDGKFVAEIDIDSHSPAPFTIDDEEFLTSLCQKLSVLF
ncbi:MAG: GAF domain-containing protein [Bacteroidia bacterium]|nr:GAF domain-containing protein [Bacteroidia bacterium]